MASCVWRVPDLSSSPVRGYTHIFQLHANDKYPQIRKHIIFKKKNKKNKLIDRVVIFVGCVFWNICGDVLNGDERKSGNHKYPNEKKGHLSAALPFPDPLARVIRTAHRC